MTTDLDLGAMDLAIVLGRLDAIAARLDRIDGLLTEFEPVIRAYLDPAASGPVAWAVRRQLGRKT